MSNEVDFRKAMFDYQKEEMKKREESSNFQPYDGEKIAYSALTNKGVRIFRILGGVPAKKYRKYGSDVKRVFISHIKCDNGKYGDFIIPGKMDDGYQNHIFWRIYNLVMEKKWTQIKLENGQVKNESSYVNEDKYPELVQRMKDNSGERKFDKGWYPEERIMMNIIDRQDMEWHRVNKHTKVLSGGAYEMESGDINYQKGVSNLFFKRIWDDAVEYFGDWEEYDIAGMKLDDEPWYVVLDDPMKIIKKDPNCDINLISKAPLTDEEKSWERYDFDSLFKYSSMRKFQFRLGNFIKKIDGCFGTTFSKELDEMVEKEKEEQEKNNDNEKPKKFVPIEVDVKSEIKSESTPSVENVNTNIQSEEIIKEVVKTNLENTKVENEVGIEVPTRKPRVSVEVKSEGINWQALADGSFNGTKYLGVPKMTDEEKALVVSVNPDGSFKYKDGLTLLKDAESNFASPESFHCDPLSGEEW